MSSSEQLVSVGQAVDVLIRPEQLDIVDWGERHNGSPAPSRLGTVQSAEYFGHDVLYQIASSGDLLLVRTTDSSRRPGDEVQIGYVGRRVVV